MVQKKLKWSQVDYELLKEARYEYNKTRQRIEQLEKEIEDLTQKPPLKIMNLVFGCEIRH